MTGLRIALLNASYSDDNTHRNFRREVDADLAEFDATAGEFPTDYDYDAVIVTGSRASVYWDEPWIEELLSWLEGSIERGLPHLGVCFGHQALAMAMGGTVEPMDEFEIGYREIRRTGDSRLLDGIEATFTAFTTHGDAVTELPPGATPIAENEYGLHGFERGNVLTVQFHPEYDLGTAREITRGKDLPAEHIESVLAGATDEAYARACLTKRLFDNFTDYVRKAQQVERAGA